ncbi:hypothetical protein ZONE111905_00845 [Zobellia nedashkovskayae]
MYKFISKAHCDPVKLLEVSVGKSKFTTLNAKSIIEPAWLLSSSGARLEGHLFGGTSPPGTPYVSI